VLDVTEAALALRMQSLSLFEALEKSLASYEQFQELQRSFFAQAAPRLLDQLLQREHLFFFFFPWNSDD
jgi:hypothetical protein